MNKNCKAILAHFNTLDTPRYRTFENCFLLYGCLKNPENFLDGLELGGDSHMASILHLLCMRCLCDLQFPGESMLANLEKTETLRV